MHKILIGSNNTAKQEKLVWLIKKYFKKIEYLDDILPNNDIPEKGNSFTEIASNKAIYLSKKYNGYIITTDSGVEIPSLDSNWNPIFTKRFVGNNNISDFDRMDALIKLMRGKDGNDRMAFWKEAIAIAKNGKIKFVTEVKSTPMIIQKSYDKKKYQEGLWLCSLFYYPQYSKNYFDLTKKELEEDGEDTWYELKSILDNFFLYNKISSNKHFYTFNLDKYDISSKNLDKKINIVIRYDPKNVYYLSEQRIFNKPVLGPYDLALAMVVSDKTSHNQAKDILKKIEVKSPIKRQKIIYYYNSHLLDINNAIKKSHKKEVLKIIKDPNSLACISAYLKQLAKTDSIIIASFNPIFSKSNAVNIEMPMHRSFNNFINHIKDTIYLNNRLKTQQSFVYKNLRRDKITVVKSVNLIREWPENPYINYIKTNVEGEVKKVSQKNKYIDYRDLLIQVLARCTTYSPRVLFRNGSKMVNYFKKQRCLDQWRMIPHISEEVLSRYKIDKKLIREIVNEQFSILDNRIQKSKLDLKTFFNLNQYFSEKWRIIKTDNGFFIKNNDKLKRILFRSVNPHLASDIHNVLHYIHSQRAEIAFGLFIEGSNFPFSIESIEPVNRPYKKNALLLYGFNPLRCIELTRLYNRPFSPMGTSSVIDKLIFNYYKNYYTDIEAVSTTIMPDYAFSKSQLSGPVNKVYLMVKRRHIFARRKIKSKEVFELVTNKKIQKENLNNFIYSHPETPLLPVFHVLHEIKKGTLNKILSIKNVTIEILEI